MKYHIFKIALLYNIFFSNSFIVIGLKTGSHIFSKFPLQIRSARKFLSMPHSHLYSLYFRFPLFLLFYASDSVKGSKVFKRYRFIYMYFACFFLAATTFSTFPLKKILMLVVVIVGTGCNRCCSCFLALSSSVYVVIALNSPVGK